MFYDSHAHFTIDADVNRGIIERALAANVTHILAMGGDDPANEGVNAFAELAAGSGLEVRRALGFCPEVTAVPKNLDAICKTQGIACIGEIGLDFHFEPFDRNLQISLFRHQLHLAAQLDLPVSVHTRDADRDMLESIDAIPARKGGLRGSIHCFTGSVDFAKRLLDRGFCLGISGIATFRKGDNVRAVAKMCPSDRLLIETDTPYLAPIPMRGQKNEPSFVPYTAKVVAEVRGETLSEVEDFSFDNAQSLFG